MKHLSSIVNPSKSRGRRWRMLGLATAAAVGCFCVAGGAVAASSSHIKTSVSLEYRVSTWYVNSDDLAQGAGGADTGIANYLRLNANFKDMNTGVSVHTSINLLGDRWVGNQQYQGFEDVPGFTPYGDKSDAVYINYAYVQVPLGKTLLRVGRQKANWADCFLVCDSSRDRILLIHPFGSVTGIAGYDKRADEYTFYNPDDSDQFFFAVVGKIPSTKFHWGFLWVHFMSNNAPGTNPGGTALSGFDVVTPFIAGDIGPVHLEGAFTYTNNGDVNIPSAPGEVFAKASWAYYLRAGWHINQKFLLRGQYIATKDGGLMSSGFNTFSSMINSSPESTNTPTSVYSMGQEHGLRGFNERLIIVNAVAQITPKVSIGGSIGQLHIEQPGTVTPCGCDSDSSMVYDFKATYQVNKAVKFWGTIGYLGSNDVGRLAGNSLIDFGDSYAGIGAAPRFNDDGVMAASLNMQVNF